MRKFTVHKARAAVIVKKHRAAAGVIVKKPGAAAPALVQRAGGSVQKRGHADIAKHLNLERFECVSSLVDPGRARKTLLQRRIAR